MSKTSTKGDRITKTICTL